VRPYSLILILTLVLSAPSAFAESGSTTASFVFDFGEKVVGVGYPTISSFRSSDATVDFDKMTFRSSATDIAGEDLVSFEGNFDPDTNEIRGRFTGFQNYESDGGKIYTRTSFDGAFNGKIRVPPSPGDSYKIIPVTGPAEGYWSGSSTVVFSKVFCGEMSPKDQGACPVEDTAYRGNFITEGIFNIIALGRVAGEEDKPVAVVNVSRDDSAPPGPSAMPIVKYITLIIVIALITYAVYFLFSGGFF